MLPLHNWVKGWVVKNVVFLLVNNRRIPVVDVRIKQQHLNGDGAQVMLCSLLS